jgi:hypothetical protein
MLLLIQYYANTNMNSPLTPPTTASPEFHLRHLSNFLRQVVRLSLLRTSWMRQDLREASAMSLLRHEETFRLTHQIKHLLELCRQRIRMTAFSKLSSSKYRPYQR